MATVEEMMAEIKAKGFDLSFNSYSWGIMVNASKTLSESVTGEGCSFGYTTKGPLQIAVKELLRMIKRCERVEA